MSEVQIATGTAIEIHFWSREDHEREMLVHAIVRYCSDNKLGVQFVDLDFSHRELLWKLRQGAP